MKTIIVGGGAAGFFAAIRLKELCPTMEVEIAERSSTILSKVKVSGGGRCNCTNTFEGVSDLQTVYPRGHRLMKRHFRQFGPSDAFLWFERHGVPLAIEDNGRVFPSSGTSESIIACLIGEARRKGIKVCPNKDVGSVDNLFADNDFVVAATGGVTSRDKLSWLNLDDDEVVEPVPSLFTLSLSDKKLLQLMGTQADNAVVRLSGTTYKSQGSLLITHWGVSGPATLRLSSYAARHLHDKEYRDQLCVNWLGMNDDATLGIMVKRAADHRLQKVSKSSVEGLPQRLWEYLVKKSLRENADRRWADLSKKEMNRLVNTLCNDTYDVSGRAPFKDEFVICGGVSLTAVDTKSLESLRRPGLFFAGEILDIDGVTGGFNFQAAWTTAAVVAQSIAVKAQERT